jgi:hypothetical protein
MIVEIYKISMEDAVIIDKVESLRNAKLIEGGHLYNRYKEFLNNIYNVVAE